MEQRAAANSGKPIPSPSPNRKVFTDMPAGGQLESLANDVVMPAVGLVAVAVLIAVAAKEGKVVLMTAAVIHL